MQGVFDTLERVVMGAVMTILATMVGVVGAQVFSRYVLNATIPWTEELARHLMIWMFFLAAVVALRRGGHLSIDILVDRLSPFGRLLIALISRVLLAVFFYLMVVYGRHLVTVTMRQFSGALEYPMGYVYMSVPVAGTLMFLVNIEGLWNAIAHYRTRLQSRDLSVAGATAHPGAGGDKR